MSLPPVILLGFGDAGPMVQHSLSDAQTRGISARYIALDGTFGALQKPHPTLWTGLRESLENENDALVIWAHDALVLWDKLERALHVNHRPDYLWPLSLGFRDGAVIPCDGPLYRAVGGFEISLYSFNNLHSFHHAVMARALVKLLTVADLNSFTIIDYLHLSWLNFESVKAPDAWLLHDPSTSFVFKNGGASATIDRTADQYKQHHRQWQMGREALDAKSRNTLAAAEFVRSNVDVMGSQLPVLADQLPYYGYWPVKAGRAGAFMIPCHGHHPVVQSYIWAGDYHPNATAIWNALFCQGAYKTVLDYRGDGHYFGLMMLRQNAGATGNFSVPDHKSMAWVQNCMAVNHIDTTRVTFDIPEALHSDMIAVVQAAHIPSSLVGICDLFIPIDTLGDMTIFCAQKKPVHYKIYGVSHDSMAITEYNTWDHIAGASCVLVLHESRSITTQPKVSS